jgi:alpha-tubulin suppressor-like RCC1 family protein
MKGTERSLSFLSVALGLTSLVTDSITFANTRTSNMVEEDVKRLIVMVDATLEGQQRIGSGIIFGFGPDQIYIVTADHVVRQAAREADEVTIRLYWSPHKNIKAKLLSHRDAALDVAVLSVPDLAGLAGKDDLPFDRMGAPNSLQRGDDIYLLGNPHGKSWRVNTTPEKFAEIRGDSLEFESNLIAPGHSGGALLNSDRELLGMLRSDQAPYGEAVSITNVATRLKDWGYPVKLRQVGIQQVSSGVDRTCMVSPDGVARCWGRFDDGLSIKTNHGHVARLKSISVGGDHVCGTAMREVAYCIGGNKYGQLGNGTREDSGTAAQLVQGGLTFVSLSAGVSHTCGVTVDFNVYCWGDGVNGQLGNDSKDDSVVPRKVSSDLAFKSVSAGTLYTCALTTSGTLYCWGGLRSHIDFGSLVPVDASDGLIFRSVSAGDDHYCGVTPAGIAYCAGHNNDGQLGIGSDIRSSDKFVPVAGGLTFKSVGPFFGSHTCGITTTEAAYCWGLNHFGQLGDGSNKNTNSPVAVSGGLKFSSISTGNVHTCGVTTDDAIYCWGGNIYGSIGSAPKKSSVPFKVMPNKP